MAAIRFIEGTPDSIWLTELITGYNDAAEAVMEPEDQAAEVDAMSDLIALCLLCHAAGYPVKNYEGVPEVLRQLDSEGSRLVREDKLADAMEVQYDPEDCPNIVRQNIDWNGVAKDWSLGRIQFEINSKNYYLI